MTITRRFLFLMLGATALLQMWSPVHAQTLSTPLMAPVIKRAPSSSPAQPSSEVDAMFKQWDVNHDGVLSPDEFRNGWQKLKEAMVLHQLHEQFTAMDTDKTACLDRAEYAHLNLIKKAGTSAPPMSMFDTNKKQCLDFNEYVNLVNYMLSHEQK